MVGPTGDYGPVRIRLWDGIKRDRAVWIGDLHPETAVVTAVSGNLDIVPQSLDWVIALRSGAALCGVLGETSAREQALNAAARVQTPPLPKPGRAAEGRLSGSCRRRDCDVQGSVLGPDIPVRQQLPFFPQNDDGAAMPLAHFFQIRKRHLEFARRRAWIIQMKLQVALIFGQFRLGVAQGDRPLAR